MNPNDPYQALIKLYQKLIDGARNEKNKYIATLIYLIALVFLLFVLIGFVIQKLNGV
jgi:hypothetical protein